MAKLNQVYAVTALQTDGSYTIRCNITDFVGDTYDCDYVSHPDDTYGLNPVIRKWLTEHVDDYEIIPYSIPPEPSIEEQRAVMLPLTARQLRLGLIRNGISLASIDAAIDSMSDGQAKDEARVEWEYATSFNRTHQLISTVGLAVNLTEEQIDSMWQQALDT